MSEAHVCQSERERLVRRSTFEVRYQADTGQYGSWMVRCRIRIVRDEVRECQVDRSHPIDEEMGHSFTLGYEVCMLTWT